MGLMCVMLVPIESIGKCITMANCFNVSTGIVDREHVQGVYGQALIKKGDVLAKGYTRRYD